MIAMRLNELTPDLIKKGPVPMDDLLKDSVYYPASRTDGRPIALCNTVWRRLGVNSFVYCDFDLSEKEFLADTHTMHGYHVLAHRHLDPSEYIPEGWKLEMAQERGDGRRGGYWDTFLGHGGPEHCACWVVFERDEDMSPIHGPERLSVLFVCGEGLATFQQLYCSRGIAPKMLCFIQCWGFAGNWTNFSGCGAPFHRTLLKYRECTPEWLCFGDCCGIHGVIRLRNLEYAGVRCLGYQTRKMLESRFGMAPVEIDSSLNRRVLVFAKGERQFAAVSISHHMEFAVYDISQSRFDLETLLDWLILTDPGRRSGHESYLNDWVGIKGLENVRRGIHLAASPAPIIDEKLNWRELDKWSNVAQAIAVVNSVKSVYEMGGVRAYSQLVRRAMEWAWDILEETAPIKLENGLPSLQRCMALNDCREWFKKLPTYKSEVHANIGFGRG